MLRLLLLLLTLPQAALPAAAAAAARPFAALAEILPLLEKARALREELPLNATTALLTRAAEAFTAARAYANASAVRGELVAVLAGAAAAGAAQQQQQQPQQALLLARLAHVEALTAERRYAQALGVLDEAGAAAGAAAAPQLAAGLLRARAQVLDCAGSAREALAALEAGLPGAPAPWPAAAPLASPAHLRMAKQYLMLLRRAGQGGGGAAARVARALLAAGPWRRADQLPRHFHPQLASAPFYDLGGSGSGGGGARGAPLPASWRGLRKLSRALAAAAPALLREYSDLAAAASPLLLQEAECIADPASGAWRYATVNAPWVEAVDDRGCALAAPVACGLLALAEREGWGGAALRGTYSAVAGGGVLREHCGMTNAQLKFHVGLRVPRRAGVEAGSGGSGGSGEPCASLTVAGETRAWEEGGVLLFDDSFVHSVVNTCPDAERVIFQLVVPHGDARGPEWDSAIGAGGD